MLNVKKATNEITEVLDISRSIQLTDGQKSVFFKMQRFNRGLRYWLNDLLLPDNVPKDEFEEEFYYSRPLANYLYAFRTLCFQLQPKHPQLILNADKLWFYAAKEKVQRSISNTGLLGNSSVVTKAEHINGMRDIVKSLQNLEAWFVGDVSAWETILLVAQETCWNSPTFEDEAFQPFLKKTLKYVEQIQQSDLFQIPYLTPDGEEYVTGKRVKVPKSLQPFRTKLVKRKELLQVGGFVVKAFPGDFLTIKLIDSNQETIKP